MNPEPHLSSASEFDPQTDQHHDRRLTSALEAAPDLVIPEGFAARVLSGLPAQHPSRLQSRLITFRRPSMANLPALPTPTVGRHASYAAAVILISAMLLTAAHPEGPTHFGATILEWSLTAEFILLTLWLTLRTLITR